MSLASSPEARPTPAFLPVLTSVLSSDTMSAEAKAPIEIYDELILSKKPLTLLLRCLCRD